MRLHTKPLPVFLLAFLAFAGACKSVKVNQQKSVGSTEKVAGIDVCNQTIKYYSEKVKLTKTGEEVTAQSEITVNPAERTISLSHYDPASSQSTNFTTIVESIDCSLNAGLTEGGATYRGYIKQQDGTTTKAIVQLEARDGGLTITNGDPEKRTDFAILISRWEVVK